MSKLETVRHSTDYGSRYQGVVEAGNRTIHTTLRAPHEGSWSGITYVLVNGWTAGKNSMREVALEAVRARHKAVTFNYTNRGMANALLSNAADCAAVIDALPSASRKAAIGLSMGGSVVTRALMQAQASLEAVTLVAPAQYISRDINALEIARHLVAEGRELPSLYRNPVHAAHLGIGVLRNCAERPLAVVAEFGEMISGTVHDTFHSVKADPAAPFMRFVYGVGDRLLPAEAQIEGVDGLAFDEVIAYSGGHVQLARDRELARTIFALDAAQMPPPFEETFSMAA